MSAYGRHFYDMIMLMNEVAVYGALILIGACLGSFAGATVWRLRAKQLDVDKKNKEPYDKEEYGRLKKLLGKKTAEDRSRCLDCGKKLKWYDLIPIVSWLALSGKCRQCKQFIGWYELAMELGMVAFFVLSYIFWPGGIETGLAAAHFILWLVAGVIMAILFVYDLKWFLLPDKLTIALAVIGLAILGVSMAESQEILPVLYSAIGSVGILAGLYAIIFLLSGGRWVGFGDVKLGIGLGLLLADWQLALVALFLANLIGCLIVLPLMVVRKLKRNARIPFGPLLISGTIIAWFFGFPILDAYLGILGI